jgi:hypothetical protein
MKDILVLGKVKQLEEGVADLVIVGTPAADARSHSSCQQGCSAQCRWPDPQTGDRRGRLLVIRRAARCARPLPRDAGE